MTTLEGFIRELQEIVSYNYVEIAKLIGFDYENGYINHAKISEILLDRKNIARINKIKTEMQNLYRHINDSDLLKVLLDYKKRIDFAVQVKKTEHKGNRGQSLNPGDTVFHYRVEEVVGSGGFGIVYLVTRLDTEEIFALKEYFPSKSTRGKDGKVIYSISSDDSKKGVENLVKEASIVALCKHDNIIRVESVFKDNDTAYAVMAFENGYDIDKFVSLYGRSYKVLLNIMNRILDGLELLHAHNFIHRDIKPSNIMIRKDGTPVLLDFGSARNPTANSRLTIALTERYAPLELHSVSPKEQGPWTDIFSLGVVIYHYITGVPIIDSVARERSIRDTGSDPLKPAVDAGIFGVPERFLKAIDWAIRINPSGRPQSVREWRRELNFSEGSDITL